MAQFEPISQQKLDRHLRFWEPLTPGEGGYLALTTRVRNALQVPAPATLEEKWFSSDLALQRIHASLANCEYHMDAIPTYFVNFGPGAMAPMLGGGYKLQNNTVWFDTAPIVSDFEDAPELKLNRDHIFYTAIKEQIQRMAADSRGAYKVSYTDIGGTMDIVASLRGSQDLLMDLVDYPEEIAAFSDQVDRCFMEYFNEQTQWIGDAGYTGWIPLVHNKTWYPLQCDFSAMISPKMFERLVLPSLDRVSSQMGTAVYHLDGPGEIVHLDMILSVPNIHAIQWVPLPDVHLEKGAYHQCFDDAMSLDIYRRVLKAGRKVVLCGVPAYQIENIFREVGSDGIFIFGGGVNNQEAKDLIDKLCRDGWLRP